jgi:hypothetical protein
VLSAEPRISRMITRRSRTRSAPGPTIHRSGHLAYAIVRLGETFVFNDAAAGMRGDVERLRDVEAPLLRVDVRG